MSACTAKQGETIPSIARKYGFHDWRIVYDDKANAELKSKRPNPNILFPGDKVVIPPMATKEEAGSTGKRHRFRLSGDTHWLRIRLENVDGSAMANVNYTLEVEGNTCEGTTGAKGLLEHKIPTLAQEGMLILKGDDGKVDQELVLKIGHLDPGEKPSGWKGRLNNMGYKAGHLDERVTPQARSAVEEFQCDQDLVPPTGKVGWKTQDTIERAHDL